MRIMACTVLLLSVVCSYSLAQFDRFNDIPKDTLEVVLVNEERESVEGATVRLYGLRAASNPGSHFGVPPMFETATTDDTGTVHIKFPRYVYEEIATTELTLEITHPDYAKKKIDNVKLDGSSNPIELSRGATLEASVSLNGKPLEKYILYIGNEMFGIEDNKPLSGIVPGTHSVYVTHKDEEGTYYYSDVVSLNAEDKKTAELSFDLYQALTLKGMVDESVPRPIQRGRVEINMINAYRDYSRPSRGQNAVPNLCVMRNFFADVTEDGSFTITDLPKGLGEVISICDVFVSKKIENEMDRMRCQSFILDENEQEITVMMEAGASVTGTVTNKEGEPIQGAMVGCSPNVRWGIGASTIFMRNFSNYSTTSDKDGRFTIKQIPPDDNVRFHVMHQDFDLAAIMDSNQTILSRTQTFSLQSGELINIDFEMEKKGTTVLGEQ